MSLSESRFNARMRGETVDIIPDFYAWLQKLGLRSYDYVVATTRRASNMVEAVRKTHPDILPHYMTENGLLLQAEEIAEFYVSHGYFPQIAILDDILVYGRNLNTFLTQFWNTICQCLSQLGIDAEADGIEKNFNQSITLCIYAVNDAPILLRHEFQWTMRSRQMLPESQWRSLSNSITKLISEQDLANTSYIVSAKLKTKFGAYLPDSSWLADNSLQYRNNPWSYSFYLFRHSPKAGVYPSVRSYVKGEFQYFTPYFFIPELDVEQVLRVLQTLFAFSYLQDPKTTNDCIDLLNRIKKFPSRLIAYAQFTFFMLSQITLSVFFQTLSPKEELIYDTEKISRNFDPTHKADPILNRFCCIKWKKSQLIKLLECLDLEEAITPIPITEHKDHSMTVNAVERLVYRQAVDHELDAAKRQQYNLGSPPTSNDGLHVNRSGEQELSLFLSRVEKKTGICPDTVAILPVLSCLTQMMDLGDISLKARTKRRGKRLVFYTSVRTTEMSLAIMPRKLAPYYRHFFLLAQLCWRDKNFPDQAERYFRDTIFEGHPNGAQEVLISNARYFAKLISENRMIVDSMLNWKEFFDSAEA